MAGSNYKMLIRPCASSRKAVTVRTGGIGLRFFPNMRVPTGTPIDQAFQAGGTQDGCEHLGEWVTSRGERLASLDVFTSARRIGTGVYALVSVDAVFWRSLNRVVQFALDSLAESLGAVSSTR